MFTDTHAHLDHPDFASDLEEVIDRASKMEVSRILTVGTGIESSRQAVALAERFSSVYAIVGVHPTNVEEEQQEFIESLRKIAAHPKVVAIGETGLDYHHLPSERLQPPENLQFSGSEFVGEPEGAVLDGAYKALQSQAFLQQLDLAIELGLNVVIHQRDAWEDTLRYLEPYTKRIRGVFHCFGGTIDEANEVISKGHLVSFTGIVTFKNAPDLQNTVAAVSSDHYMIETDCPYLAPVPYRGKRCEPGYVRHIAEKISQLRGESLDYIARQTTTTADAFFQRL